MKCNKSFHIGARTFKTALAVFLCMLIAWFVPNMDGIHSCISTIICMMPTSYETVKVGLNRIMATVFACTSGMLVLLLYSYMPNWYNLVRMFLVPSFVILLIFFCNFIKKQEAILLCTTVFIALSLGPQMTFQGAITYSAIRFIETVIGILIAFVVNSCIRPQRKCKEEMERTVKS